MKQVSDKINSFEIMNLRSSFRLYAVVFRSAVIAFFCALSCLPSYSFAAPGDKNFSCPDKFVRLTSVDGEGCRRVDENGDVLWHGPWRNMYDGKVVKEAGTYDFGKKVGRWESFYPSSSIETRGTYKDSKLDGPYSEWHRNGKKRVEAVYFQGLRVTWRSFYDSEKLESEEEFDEAGLLTGVSKTWYDNGKQRSETSWKKGLKDGVQTIWDRSGVLLEQISFSQNERDGKYFKWYAKDSLAEQAEYLKGNLTNQRTLWYPNGQKKFEAHYENGKLHGVARVYNGDGVQRYELRYEQGEVVEVVDGGIKFKLDSIRDKVQIF